MSLDEFFRLIEELRIMDTGNKKEDMSVEAQMKRAAADPAIPNKRL